MKNYLRQIEEDVKGFILEITGKIYTDEEIECFKKLIKGQFNGEVSKANLYNSIKCIEQDDDGEYGEFQLFWNNSYGFLRHYITTNERIFLPNNLQNELTHLLIQCIKHSITANIKALPLQFLCYKYLNSFLNIDKYNPLFVLKYSTKQLKKLNQQYEEHYKETVKKYYVRYNYSSIDYHSNNSLTSA